MKAIGRLFKYLKYKKIPHTRFEKEVGLSNGYLNTQLKRDADLGEGVLNKIVNYCLDLNSDWLLTGKGSMLEKKAGIGLMSDTDSNEQEAQAAAGNVNVGVEPPPAVANHPSYVRAMDKIQELATEIADLRKELVEAYRELHGMRKK